MFKRVNHKNIMKLCLLVLIVGVATTSNSFAGPDLDPASRDILFNPRFEGNMQTIKPVTNFLDIHIVRLISIIGFATILVAMLRNAMSALVCVNYKFFMKIHQMKMDGANAQGGWGQRVMAAIIPDVIPFTDFEEGISSPKEYVLKAIPLAVVSVFIGSFIFSSYYRDTIGNFSVLGLHIVDRFVISRDYVGDFDKIVDMGTDYEFMFDKTKAGKQKLELAKKMYSVVRGLYGNINDTEAKATLGSNVEAKVKDWLSNGPGSYFGNEAYSFSYAVSATNSSAEPNIGDNSQNINGFKVAADTTGEIKVFTAAFRAGDLSGNDQDKKGSTYIKAQLTFKPSIFNPGGGGAAGKEGVFNITSNWSTTNGVMLVDKLPMGKDEASFGSVSDSTWKVADQLVKLEHTSKGGFKITAIDSKGKVVKDWASSNDMTLTHVGGSKLQYGAATPIITINFHRDQSAGNAKGTIVVGNVSTEYGTKVNLDEVEKSMTNQKKGSNGGDDKPSNGAGTGGSTGKSLVSQ